jgi:hypothetical protein
VGGRPATGGGAGPSPHRPPARWGALVVALVCGTAIAAPQLVELARVLPTSLRGVRGYSLESRTIASWDPRQALEQILPLAYGRLDRSGPGGFWAHRFHTGHPPLFVSLYVGVLPAALLVAAGWARRRGGALAWTLIALGLLVALGRFNPLFVRLADLPGSSLLRFPIKAWWMVALGLSILAAIGWERAVVRRDPAAARRLRAALLAVAVVLLIGAGAIAARETPLQTWMSEVRPSGAPPTLVVGEARRWAMQAGCLAGLAAVLAALLWKPGREWRGAAALTLHAGVQLLLLAPTALARDSASPHLRRPAFAAVAPAGTRLAIGGLNGLFGPVARRRPPKGEMRWAARQGSAAGYPAVGVPAGWRYELHNSPEGLDGFLTRAVIDAIKQRDDVQRVRLLRVSGVELLVLERALGAGIPDAALVMTVKGPLAPVYVYRLAPATPAVRRVAGARRAENPRRALATLLEPGFDLRREVVLQGAGTPTPPGAGSVRVERESRELLVVSSHDHRPGWVVVQRAWQPHWRASVDGRPAAVVAADLHRLAVAVPAGEHRLRLWVDRTPLRRACWAAAAGLLGLVVLGLGWYGNRSHG